MQGFNNNISIYESLTAQADAQRTEQGKSETLFLRKLLQPDTAQPDHDDSSVTSPWRVSEAFHKVYMSLLAAQSFGSPPTLLVCGPNGAEGTTTIAIGVAVAAANRSGGVLVIDSSRNQTVWTMFGKPSPSTEPLFLEIGKVSYKIIPTGHPGLSLMTRVGPGTDPICRAEIQSMLAAVKPMYQTLIIDGPPVNLFADSCLFGSEADRVLLVLYSGRTRKQVVAEAVNRLGQWGCSPSKMTVFLNHRIFPIPEFLYRQL